MNKSNIQKFIDLRKSGVLKEIGSHEPFIMLHIIHKKNVVKISEVLNQLEIPFLTKQFLTSPLMEMEIYCTHVYQAVSLILIFEGLKPKE